VPLALILACVGLWTGALVSSAAAGSTPAIEITQCTGDPTTDPQSCDTRPTTVNAARPAPRPASRPAPKPASRPAPPTETHNYSLTNGKGKVQTTDGQKKSDTIKVSLSPAATQPPAPKPHHPPAAPPPPPPPPVTTTGGAPNLSVASPFSFVSADQALAQFEIPPFLVPIYLAAGRTYGIPWNVLASINRIETDFGRNLSVSSAGAEGWMQFMPDSWKTYGVDATGDGVADPYNPVDAIYAAARYLRASGGATDLRKAIFSYNHASWYVDEVLKNAGVYGSLPPGLVAETGSLAFGRFPVVGRVRYADDFRATRPAGWGPPGLLIHGPGAARAVATQQVTVRQILLDPQLAATLARTGSLARLGAAPIEPGGEVAAMAMRPLAEVLGVAGRTPGLGGHPILAAALTLGRLGTAAMAAAPARTTGVDPLPNGLPPGYARSGQPGIGVVVADKAGNRYLYRGLGQLEATVRPGATVAGGQALGRLPAGPAATLDYATVAAGGEAVDPRPLVDGYRLQEAANFYHAVKPFGGNPFVPPSASQAPASKGYVFPIPSTVPWTSARTDMGWDIETGDAGVGKPLLAIGDARILHIQDMGAFGPTWITYQLLSGPAAGKTVFIGHSGPPLVQPGQVVHAGEPIILIHGGSYGGPPGHFEIGWGNSDGSNTLASPHYSEGDVTPEGVSFKAFLLGVSGSKGGISLAQVLGGTSSDHATKAEEARLAAALDKIANPSVSRGLGPGAVRLPGGSGPAAGAAKGPAAPALTLQPAGAGAQLDAVAVPSDAVGDEAYGVGRVSGLGRRGWAADQTVLLAYRRGEWRSLGPPLDARGRVVNPRLRALAAVAGGTGYAVGDRGALVAFDGARVPRLIASGTRARLADVAVRTAGGGVQGVAVGERGALVRLRDDAGTAAAPTPGSPDLTSVTFDSSGTPLVTAVSGPELQRDDGHGLSPVPLSFGLPAGARVQLDGVASRGSQLWVFGDVSDQAGAWGHLPFAARRVGGGWRTYCAAGPQAAAVWELGARTPSACAGDLGAGTGARGPVRAVALTDRGAVAATSAGLELGGQDFRPVDPPASSGTGAGSTAVQQLALSPRGDGWALDGAGRVARVLDGRGQAPTAPRSAVFRLPGTSPGRPAPVAVALGGDRALALSSGAFSTLTGSTPRTGRGPGVGVRAAAVAPGGATWAIADSGQLLGYRDGRWFLPGDATARLRSLLEMTRVLGEGGVATAPGSTLSAGFNALDVRAADEGYAVGGHGVIARFDGTRWSADATPTTRTLVGVADAPGVPVAVGSHGTLLERRGGRWAQVAQAGSLVGNADLTAVTALRDGTVVAAAGGATIVRDPGATVWRAAPIAPAGGAIQRLAGYRDAARRLHVVAMVDGAGGPALLDGDATGWRPLALPAGLEVSDVRVDERASDVWVGAAAGASPVVAQLAVPSGGTVTTVAPSPPDTGGLAGLAAGATTLPAAPEPAPVQGPGPVAATRFHGKDS
jgi:hypothetical protein